MTEREPTYLYSDITGKILDCFYKVYNSVGFGFTRNIYVNALLHEIRKHGMSVEPNKIITIYYNQLDIGDVTSDLVVSHTILVDVTIDRELDVTQGQILYNKLRSSQYEVGLLLNFGKMPEQVRKIYTNDRKAL